MLQMAERPFAVVLLRHPVPAFDAGAIAARHHTLFPLDLKGLQPADSDAGDAWPLLLKQGPDTLAARLVDAPMPGEQLTEPTAAAYWWPQATTAVAAHTAHLVIAARDPLASDVKGIVATARRVTRLAAALAMEADAAAIGVFWSGSRTLWPTQDFVTQAREYVPYQIWVDIRLPRGGARTSSASRPTGCGR